MPGPFPRDRMDRPKPLGGCDAAGQQALGIRRSAVTRLSPQRAQAALPTRSVSKASSSSALGAALRETATNPATIITTPTTQSPALSLIHISEPTRLLSISY